MNISKITLLFIFLIIFSFGLNIFLLLKINNIQNSVISEQFHLINPFTEEYIDSNIQDANLILHYNGLNETIQRDIKLYNAAGKVSIFLQDTKTGAWMGINEKEGFIPASLLKIPIMIAILKKVDREEISLKDRIELIQSDINYLSGTLYKLERYNVSIEDLLKEMILSSDNTAKNALKRQLSPAEINAVFAHIGIPNPYIDNNSPIISPRGYTRLLKSLYFSTFLSPALSEKALDFTTDTQEENLISKEIPPEIQVAHKFGMNDNGIHDCGIIYHPKNPYFLCIMTKDLELEINKKLINQISKDIFEFIDKK